jgi:hypothetical protein
MESYALLLPDALMESASHSVKMLDVMMDNSASTECVSLSLDTVPQISSVTTTNYAISTAASTTAPLLTAHQVLFASETGA